MKFIHRLAYFSGGFILGIGLLIFILSGKKTSCAYGPNSRTLKNIRLKKHTFSENTLQTLRKNNLDTMAIIQILTDGDVLFSESNTELDSCKVYSIEGDILLPNGEESDKILKIEVENCEKTANVLNAKVQ